MPPAVEAVLQAAPLARETIYASEDSEVLLSFAQALVREGEIPGVLRFAQEDSDLCSELRQRGMLDRLVFVETEPTAGKKPSNLPLPRNLSAATARTLELQGKSITDGQMYRLICYLCFGIGTTKPLIGGVHSNKTTIQNRMLQKLNGSSEGRTQFRTCWRQMESAGAIAVTKRKKERVYALNNRPGEVKDSSIRKIIRKVLEEQRKINSH